VENIIGHSLVACVNASLKTSFFCGHIFISDTLNEYKNEWSIRTAAFNGTVFQVEARTLYELLDYIKDIQINFKDGLMKI